MIQYNNFLMKREQSRAGSRFAECEKSRLKAKILITLALLLTAVTGAWADETPLLTIESKDYTTFTSGSKTFDDKVTVTFSNEVNNHGDSWGWFRGNETTITVTAANNDVTITKVKFYCSEGSAFDEEAPFEAIVKYEGGDNIAKVNGTSIGRYGITKIEVYGTAAPPIKVTPGSSANTWTFSMPGSDVVLTPLYAPAAKWATEGDAVLAPTAIEGVIAGTTDAIVKAGTVVEGQGTVMYFATTEQLTAEQAAQADGWLSTLPTAANIADDGATVYVWYYIKGTDTPDGQEATAENTFNDSEICAQPLEVIVLSNKFDITFNAANANTIEAGKATVKVGETAAEVKEGKLTGVKMGSKVTITAKDGYKFRKVEVKKGGAATLATALENGATVVISCNWGYAKTTFTYTNNGGTFSGQASGYEADYFNNGLELNGKNLSFGASNVDNSEFLSVGITFNTESSAYSYTGKGEDFVSFTISVNGTDVTDQLSELK